MVTQLRKYSGTGELFKGTAHDADEAGGQEVVTKLRLKDEKC